MTDGERAPLPKQPSFGTCAARLIALCLILLFLFLPLTTALIHASTVFKPQQPRTRILPATVEGFAPRISFPAFDIQLNITLALHRLFENQACSRKQLSSLQGLAGCRS